VKEFPLEALHDDNRSRPSGNRKLLIVEDDIGLQKQLRWSLDQYDVVFASDRESAISQVRRHEPAVVTLDLGLPPDADGATEGLATLRQILELMPDTKVIIVSGNSEHANAVKAVGSGAYDLHPKPIDIDTLRLVIERAFHLHALQQENRKLMSMHVDSPLAGIITRDAGMLKVCRTVEKVASSSATMMILGESGTGKELIARALHTTSRRLNQKFIAINCAAIPETLLESELFGYERGAFTGAAKQTIGKIEMAHKGTFFLDEVGDLPLSLQAKLLRFLQQRTIERVGGREEIAVDVRIVCATHRNLKELAAKGQFREDLYYRLSEIVLTLPPLRERVGDTALLAHHFKNKFVRLEGRSALSFSQDALDLIETYAWPGNIREMENCIKRAVIMSEGRQITAMDLGLIDDPVEPESINLRQVRDIAECKAVLRALARMDGNIAKAADLLGVSRPTLYDLMNRHGIQAKHEKTANEAELALRD
jgi:two-component system, NtrC family, response regulator